MKYKSLSGNKFENIKIKLNENENVVKKRASQKFFNKISNKMEWNMHTNICIHMCVYMMVSLQRSTEAWISDAFQMKWNEMKTIVRTYTHTYTQTHKFLYVTSGNLRTEITKKKTECKCVRKCWENFLNKNLLLPTRSPQKRAKWKRTSA